MQKQDDKKRILRRILKNPGNNFQDLDDLENFEVDLRYYLCLSRTGELVNWRTGELIS
jgi:hypothetical protein